MRPLVPLALLYGGAVFAKNLLYERNIARPKKLKWPVVSVGNLSVGGAGKTPFVIALILALRKHGYECDVLTRGYGRKTRGAKQVDPSGSAERFGDEPLLIARQTETPVFVGESRYEAGRLAEVGEPQSERIHLLDDGFQHRKLARIMDIVLMSERDVQDELLPLGRLREPLSSLRRADEIAVDEKFVLPESAEGKAVIRYRRLFETDHAPKPIAFCGIARPERFFRDVSHHGMAAVDTVAFPDHHFYSEKDIARLLQLREQYGAYSFLTTEKDYVRLSAEQVSRLQPLYPARLRIEFEDADRVVSSVLSTIMAHGGHA